MIPFLPTFLLQPYVYLLFFIVATKMEFWISETARIMGYSTFPLFVKLNSS